VLDCLFCKIISGEIPSKKVYEDEKCYAFYDIDPKAPLHFLVVPKIHLSSIDAIDESNSEVAAHIFVVISKLAKEMNLTNGYRVVANTGEDGGQTVPHLHFHVLGKRSLAWPPG
jgi:histidine triad (HIT) family protein